MAPGARTRRGPSSLFDGAAAQPSGAGELIGSRGSRATAHFFGSVTGPRRLTVSVELIALLLIVKVPSCAPSAVGVNLTVTSHLPLGLIVAPQSSSIAKSPSASILVKVTGLVLLSLSILTLPGLLTAPSRYSTLPRSRSRGEIFSRTGTGVAVGVAVAVSVRVAVAVSVSVAVAV